MHAAIATPRKYSKFDADQSADILRAEYEEQKPFFFIRYGDGAIECINRLGLGRTCDGERYSPALGFALRKAWDTVLSGEDHGNPPFVGDWLSSNFKRENDPTRYEKQFADLIGSYRPVFLHPEAILLMRESQAVINFYRTVRHDQRRKVFMGPAECAGAARLLRAEHVITPMRNLFEQLDTVRRDLSSRRFDVLLYGAGMAGSIVAADSYAEFPERTYINVGSAFDPLFRGKTRQQQLGPAQLQHFLIELLA